MARPITTRLTVVAKLLQADYPPVLTCEVAMTRKDAEVGRDAWRVEIPAVGDIATANVGDILEVVLVPEGAGV